MTTIPHQPAVNDAVTHGSREGEAGLRAGLRPIIDLSAIDLSRRLYDRDAIARTNPHRGDMALLDAIIWCSEDYKNCVAIKHVREDEFWVPGHFPGKPMMPGVLMVEAGAQLACFSFNKRRPTPQVVAFLRIEDCSFRSMVQPGDDLIVLVRETKFGRRQFESDIQGLVGDRIAFSARISGMSIG